MAELREKEGELLLPHRGLVGERKNVLLNLLEALAQDALLFFSRLTLHNHRSGVVVEVLLHRLELDVDDAEPFHLLFIREGLLALRVEGLLCRINSRACFL